MRPKRNRTSQERLEKVCGDPVFQSLRRSQPNFLERISIVNGDLGMPGLGIEPSTHEQLQHEINVVIHAAADVRFNEPLFDLLRCNLFGTRELLELSKEMKSLEAFIYVSTAFSNCTRESGENIAEDFYPPPMDADVLINYVQQCATENDRELLNIISPNLIKPWPNNYTFSKALSESLVRRYGKLFPIAVIRPTISAYNRQCDSIIFELSHSFCTNYE